MKTAYQSLIIENFQLNISKSHIRKIWPEVGKLDRMEIIWQIYRHNKITGQKQTIEII